MSLDSDLIAIPSNYSPLDYLQAAQQILAKYGPVVALGVGSPSKPHPQTVIDALEDAQPSVRAAKAERDQLASFVSRIRKGGISPAEIRDEANLLLASLAAVENLPAFRPGYKEVIGQERARDAAAQFVNHFCGGDFSANHAVITFGSSEAHKFLAEHFGRHGKAMMLIEPYYPFHVDQIQDSGARLAVVHTQAANGYLPGEAEIEAALQRHPDTGAITLVYPNNPTGKTLTQEEARKFGALLNSMVDRHPDLQIILEEVYVPIVNPDIGVNSIYPHLNPQARANCCVLISGSKSLSMAEERVGAVMSHNRDFVNMLAAAKGNDSQAVPMIFQRAFEAGLRELINNPNMQHELWDYYGSKIRFVANNLSSITNEFSVGSHAPIIAGEPPQGGMFVMASFRDIKGRSVPSAFRPLVQSDRIETENHFVKMLLGMTNAGYIPVAVAPGQAFGLSADDMAVRISCVASEDVLEQGLNTIRGALQLLQPGLDLGARPNHPDHNESKDKFRIVR